ncbi:MAG: 50S ribosomal protein L7 [Ruminococcus sp.]|jgi:ribosomal protein L7Ae-like RNA K-turn-binding protein|nr:50S ribosomal protein L7 [Ruminococcus sp.]
MHYQKLTGLISICRKAGKMAMGFDPMREALDSGKAHGILTTQDISPKTYKEVCFHCQKKQIPVHTLPLTQAQLGLCLGRRAAVIAILDKGFFESIQKLCSDVQQ